MLHLSRFQSMLCCSLLLALSALALAQSGRKAQGQGSSHKSEEGFTVSVRTEEVILPITVRDSLGRLVPGLGAQDFFIYDNGQRQQVENFNRRRIPVHVLFLLDASRSVFERMEVIRRAALSFVKTLAPEDRVAVLQFADQVHTLQDWTGNDDDIRHALSWKYRPGQATAFYDALVAAAEKLRQVEGRRAIILLTDGLNTKGHASFAQGLEAVRRAEATVYVVSETEAQARLLRRDTKGAAGLLGRIFGGPYQAQAEHYLALLESAERELAMLADASGGRLYLPLEERDLARAYEEVAEELKTQYIITYVPTSERPSAEAYHQIEVLVRGGYQAHTRRGYYKQQQ